MTEPTMEEYMIKTQEDYGSGVVRPKYDKDVKFELKDQFLKELCDHTFSGSDDEDANEHIERVLKIIELFTTLDVTIDQLMLRVFPITLTGAASRWLRNESVGSITTRGILKGNFLNKYCPPSRIAKRWRKVIIFSKSRMKLFTMLGNDSRLDVPTRQILDSKGGVPEMSATDGKKAIQEMADYSQKWHDETFTRFKSSNTSNGLIVIQAQLNNLGREIKKVNERVNQGTSIKALEIQIGQMSKVLQEKGSRILPSLTETNPRDHVNLITTTKEAETLKEDDKMPLIELSRATIPFPARLKENGYDEKEVLMKLKKLQVSSTKLATKRLLKEKLRIEEEINATTNDLDPEIEDGEIIYEPKIDIVKI
nr:hypothetical protein [Tanacetum cinerariifolium]